MDKTVYDITYNTPVGILLVFHTPVRENINAETNFIDNCLKLTTILCILVHGYTTFSFTVSVLFTATLKDIYC